MGCSRCLIPILALVFVLLGLCEGKEVMVGGHIDSWRIPQTDDELVDWCLTIQFYIGDVLTWKYDGKNDSVLEVSRHDYRRCNIENPIRKFDDGNTTVVLDRTGAFYFISGAPGHCDKGEKIGIFAFQIPENAGGLIVGGAPWLLIMLPLVLVALFSPVSLNSII